MEAKKGKLFASTPARADLKNFFGDKKSPSDIGSPPAANKKAAVLDMIVEAINATSIPKKGASYQAIKKWITDNKDADPVRLKSSLKVALKRGIDKGILRRPQKSTAVGATGSFMLALQKPLKSSIKVGNTTSKKVVSKSSEPEKTKTLPSKASSAISSKPPSQSKKVANVPKPSPKKTEMNLATSSKAKAKKNSSQKGPSKANGKKKPAVKLSTESEGKENFPLESNEDPANAKVISEVQKKQKFFKNKVVRNRSLVLRAKAKLSLSRKSLSKAKGGKTHVSKVASKAKNTPKPDKESTENDLSLSDDHSDKDLATTKVISRNIKNERAKNKAKESYALVFSESDDPVKVEISDAPKRKATTKAPAINKTVKSNVEKSKPVKGKGVSSNKDEKEKVKEVKKATKPAEISREHVNRRQRNA